MKMKSGECELCGETESLAFIEDIVLMVEEFPNENSTENVGKWLCGLCEKTMGERMARYACHVPTGRDGYGRSQKNLYKTHAWATKTPQVGDVQSVCLRCGIARQGGAENNEGARLA